MRALLVAIGILLPVINEKLFCHRSVSWVVNFKMTVWMLRKLKRKAREKK